MALSFPSSPTNGQTYTYSGTTYTYDGKRWVAKTNTVSQASTNVNLANVAPSNPAQGQLWMNSDTGTISVYALGGWVSIGSINSTIAAGSITGSMIANTTITGNNIVNSTITALQIADGAITSTKLASGAAVPSQTGNSGKYLTTNGTTASWATVSAGASNTSIRAQAMTMGIIFGG